MKILKETKKALFIETQGITTWIQKRWLRADNSLTPKGIAAVATTKEKQADPDDGLTKVTDFISWENEKCVGLDFDVLINSAGHEKKMRIFLSKKLLTDGKIKTSKLLWIAEKNANEKLLFHGNFNPKILGFHNDDKVFMSTVQQIFK